MSTPRLLSIVLAIQAALVVLTWWPANPEAHKPHSLLDLTPDALTSITIERKPTSEVTRAEPLELVREDDRWKIHSKFDYPADPQKVKDLVGKLLDIHVSAPIATRATSHNALHVGEKDYGRRVTLRAGETEHTLVVGAAQSRSANVRLADQKDVYLAKGLSEWSLRDTPSSYWDTTYVSADAAGLTAVSIHNDHGTIELRRDTGGWKLDSMHTDMPTDMHTDAEAVDSLLGEILHVGMTEPVGTELEPKYGLDSGARVNWTVRAENSSVAGGYRVGAEANGDVYMKSDSSPFVVKANKSAIQALLDATKQGLLSAGAAPAAEPEPAVGAAKTQDAS